MKNNLFRKSLSVFLAMLMVLSCWVFVPEVHDHSVAEAVASNVRGVPAIRGSHYAGTTAAYGTPVFDGNLDRWFKFHNKGSDYVQIYYPSNIYLDKSETLQSAGYFFNVNWAFGNSSDYRILIGAPALGDNSAYSGYPDKYYTMTNCFNNYGFDSSVPSGGAKKVYNTSTGGTDYDLRIVGYGHSTQGSDGFSYDGTRHDKYVLYRSYSGNPNTATIYLMGTPKGEYDKKEYNTTGASLGSYGYQQNYKSGWKENNNSMFKQKSYDQANDGCSSYYEGQYAEMQWFVTVYDKSALNAVITNADSLLTQKGKYTTASLNNLQNVLNANRGVLTTRATNQNSINEAKDNIQAAIDNLVEFGVAFDNLFNFNEFVIAGDLAVNERTDKGFTVTSTAADGNTGFSKAIPVVPGKTYVLSADVGITAVSGGYDMYIHTLDANQSGETTAVPDTSNGAHREGDVYISLTGQTTNSTPYIRFTAGSNTKFVKIRFDANTPGNKLTVNNIRLLNETDYEGVSYVPTKMFKNNASLGSSFTVPTRTGYTFKRWYADNDVDGMYDSGEEVTDANGNIVSALSDYKIGQNWILHSDWTEHQYSITFNANGGSGSTTGISNVLYSADTKLTANGFARTGHTFTGWNTKADGTGTAYADGATVSKLTATNGATVTLYAQWSINKHTVAFEKIDGTTTSAQYNYGTAASAITKPANTATKDNGDNHTVYSWPEINDVTGNYTYKEFGTTSEHNYGDWVITVYSNCETEGSKYRLCQTCGHREDAVVEKAAHTLVHVDAVPSTCTADGNIEYWYCDDCGKMFSDANGTTEITTVVDTAKGHTEEILPAVESSCTATGLTEGKKCSVCGFIIVAQQTTNKKAHSMGDWSQTTAPTCTAEGQNTRKCANCDYTETETVEATGHSYTSTVTAPTCTEKGYTTHTCSNCGDTYTDTETAATGHSYGTWASYDATTHRRTCNNCTDYESGTHAFTEDVQPKSGEFHDYACEICEARGAKLNGVDTKGAGEACTFEKTTDYKAPTCLEDGYQVYKCSACTNTKTEKLTATDHKWATATYTWSQTDGVWSCTATRVCENDDTHVQTADSVEVTFEEAQAATCTEMGKTTYTATFESGVNWVTTQTQTLQDIPALGHSYSAEVTTRPELVDGVWSDGEYTYTCSGCGDSYTQPAVRADYSEFDKAVDELNGLLGNSKLTADARHEIDEALKLAEDLAKNLVSSEQITVNECTDLLKKSISNVNSLLDSLGEPQPIVNANSGLKVQFLEQTGAGAVESIQLKAGGGFDPIRLKLTNNNATLPITVTSVAADKANIGSVGVNGTVIAVNGSTDLNITAPAGFNETGIITYTITYKVGSDATGYLMDESGEAVVFTTNAYIYVKGEAYTPYHFVAEKPGMFWQTSRSKWNHYVEAVNYGDFGLISYNTASKFSEKLESGTKWYSFGTAHDTYDYDEDGCQAGCKNGNYSEGDGHAATYRYYVDTSLAPTWQAAGFRLRIVESADSVYENAPLKSIRVANDQIFLDGIKGDDKTFTLTFYPSATGTQGKTWAITSTGTLEVSSYANSNQAELLFGEHKADGTFNENTVYAYLTGEIPSGVTDAKFMLSPRLEFNGTQAAESVTMTSHIWLTSYDKGALRAAVNGAETAAYNNMYFTADSWNAYQTALADAKEVLGKVETTQADVDRVTKALTDAVADLEIAEYVLTVTHNIRENADINADPAVKTVYYLLEEGEFTVPYDAIKNDAEKINKYDDEATLTITATAEHTYNYWYIDYTQAEEALKDVQEILDNPDGYSEEFLQKVEDAKTALEAVLDGKNETTAPEEQKTVDDVVDAVTELTGHTCTDGEVVVENNNDPDCENDGSYDNVTYCTVCGKQTSRETVVVDALGHSFTNYVSDGNATCLGNGTETAKCDRCDVTDTREDDESALGHSFTNYVSNKDATCLEDGTKTAKCDRCDATDTVADEGSALGHSFTNYVSDGNATCLGNGTETAKCDRCDVTDTREDDESALGHSFTNYVSNKDATCLEDGTKTAKCDRCDATDTVADEGSALGHSFTNYESDGNATCLANGTETAKCDRCDATNTREDVDSALGHKDDNKDHKCDNDCEVYQGEHTDADKNHTCDYGCAETIGTCEDKDLDHDCDYGCDKVYGTCEDTDLDHDCDYGCDKYFGTCEDTDFDHKCDYGCDAVFGTCEDKDLDHDCDYGCDAVFGTCEDADLDHDCDYGCDKVYGTCEDKDLDHDCDYGCDKTYGDCVDNDKDHACDYGCDAVFGTCEDTDFDHDCDYGCDKYFGTHADSATDNDHVCDYGCGAVLEECKDKGNDGDHSCDVCGKAEITDHEYGEADCEKPATCTECAAKTGTALGHSFTNYVSNKDATCLENGTETAKCDRCDVTHTREDVDSALGHKDDNKDHKCDNDCEVYQGEHTDADKNHTCDYGCAETIGTCEDTDFDHKCDYGCDAVFGTCEDADLDHTCDYGCDKVYGDCEDKDLDHDCDYGCDKVYGTCEDTDFDHKCDYGCDVVFGTCEDTDFDHDCDYGCDKVYGDCVDNDKDHDCDYGCDKYFGTHADSATDDNHVCDYGCGVVLEACKDTENDGDHNCDVCGKTEITDHEYGKADCEKPATCTECGAKTGTALGHSFTNYESDGNATCLANGTETAKCDRCDVTHTREDVDSALGHKDDNKDHKCDNGCEVYQGEHADADKNHTCDYGCAETIGTCEDKDLDHDCDYGCDKVYGDCVDNDKDHACDYGCDKVYGTCEDADLDHTCDYGCDKVYGTCEDKDLDHDCDYGCDVVFGTCEDTDFDHDCDYGCDAVFGTCEDTDFDHACDYGCDKYFGTHADSAEDKDHVCDYGCGAVLEECVDSDKDHKCDNGCEIYFGEHKDADTNHVCDYGCDVKFGTCEDKDLDHKCDYGCDKVYGDCEDKDFDHKCDYGCDKAYGDCVDNDKDHACDYGCDVVFGTCEDTDFDHKCDYGCDKAYGTCEDKDFDHACDYGCDKYFGTHADSSEDNDHVCDYGCGAVLEACKDTENDGDHNCDVCGKTEITDHEYGKADCEKPATCTECGAKTGTALGHSFTNYESDGNATCLANGTETAKCDRCDATNTREDVDSALGHKDDNKDHKCDNGCAVYQGEHADADKNHTCDYGCAETIGTHADSAEDKDHVCDYGCGAVLEECVDSDKDHKCDNGCEIYFGEHKDADTNHVCDYGCDAVFGTCEDKDNDHDCDYGCDVVFGTCEDKDLDHDCDYGCDKTYGDCEDKDLDHDCDYGCDKVYGTCEDADLDHACDYGCDKTYGTCEDKDLDHDCDYGCDKAYGDCEDKDLDHKCDYGCDAIFGTCEDKDLDHDCDYGCDKVYGDCEDTDLDHKCDYGCDKVYGDCEDKDLDHDCDYGCDKVYGDCEDKDLDHDCDYGCDAVFGTCEDADFDHDCDYGCDVVFGTCEDTDLDHDCDYGCDAVFGTCEDTDFDHKCDYGCDAVFGTCEDKDFDHDCDYGCDKAYGDCEDKDLDHVCDYGCDAVFGTCEDADFDHDCDYGCDVVFGTHADSATDDNHVCDYGCGEVLEGCKDKENDGDHNCDVCGKAEITDHEYGEADCEKPATCTECGAETGTALGHDMQLTEEKIEPDCDNAGKQAVYTCANGCGKTEGGEIIPATGHTYKATVTAPTCTKEGYTTYTCSCGDSYIGIKVPATGHTWGEWIGSGDCTETVTLTRTCTECDATETKTVTGNSHKVPLDSEGNPLYDNFREEDCESGRYIVYTCDVCGSKVIEIGEPLGHKIETEHLEPTCVKDGYTLERCTVCNYTVKTTHEKLGHTWVSKPDKAPTCDENGYENYVECLTCGDVHYDVISNTGHVDNNGDGKCDGCERDILSGDCGCFCHSNNWIMKIIYAIIRFIWKIFGIHRTCVCGMAHF